MDNYLEKYCTYLTSSKESVSINKSQEYISTYNDSNIDEIISYFQKYINIQNVFNLVDSSNFYKGHGLKSKYLILIQFFQVIYNYAKNLILNYEIYSAKSIKTSTPQVKNCLSYIPNYNNYLRDLLGYVYNSTTNEWCIEENIPMKDSSKLAGVCILCTYSYQILMDAMVNNHLSVDDDDDDDPDDHDHDYDDKKEEEKSREKDILGENQEKTWNCKFCNFINENSLDNCVICFNSNKGTILKSHVNNNNLVNEIDKNKWECGECTFINSFTNSSCAICNSNISKSIVDNKSSDDNDTDSSSDSSDAPNDKNEKMWKCVACSKMNEINTSNCSACFKFMTENVHQSDEELINKNKSSMTPDSIPLLLLERKKENESNRKNYLGKNSFSPSSINSPTSYPKITIKNNTNLDVNSKENIGKNNGKIKSESKYFSSQGYDILPNQSEKQPLKKERIDNPTICKKCKCEKKLIKNDKCSKCQSIKFKLIKIISCGYSFQ